MQFDLVAELSCVMSILISLVAVGEPIKLSSTASVSHSDLVRSNNCSLLVVLCSRVSLLWLHVAGFTHCAQV